MGNFRKFFNIGEKEDNIVDNVDNDDNDDNDVIINDNDDGHCSPALEGKVALSISKSPFFEMLKLVIFAYL